jgi:hypothetical protein
MKTDVKYKVKVLSLKRRKDRQEKVKKVLDGIDFEFHWGIDGREYKLTEWDKKWIYGNTYIDYGIHTPSLVATNHSHNNILKDCIKDGIPYFVFEDDVKLLKPIDFSFQEIANKDLDCFWMVPHKPSILSYVVWPRGARKLIKYTNRKGGLSVGFDYSWSDARNIKRFIKSEHLWDDYFYQIAGDEDSDITTKLYYGLDEIRMY